MTFLKLYRIVKLFTAVFLIAVFASIDVIIFMSGDYRHYFLFVPLELLFVFLWILILRFNRTIIYRIDTDSGKIDIFTYDGDFTVRAEKIRVKKGKVFSLIYFNNKKFRAYTSSKSVKAFLHKYQLIYKTVR